MLRRSLAARATIGATKVIGIPRDPLEFKRRGRFRKSKFVAVCACEPFFSMQSRERGRNLSAAFADALDLDEQARASRARTRAMA